MAPPWHHTPVGASDIVQRLPAPRTAAVLVNFQTEDTHGATVPGTGATRCRRDVCYVRATWIGEKAITSVIESGKSRMSLGVMTVLLQEALASAITDPTEGHLMRLERMSAPLYHTEARG